MMSLAIRGTALDSWLCVSAIGRRSSTIFEELILNSPYVYYLMMCSWTGLSSLGFSPDKIGKYLVFNKLKKRPGILLISWQDHTPEFCVSICVVHFLCLVQITIWRVCGPHWAGWQSVWQRRSVMKHDTWPAVDADINWSMLVSYSMHTCSFQFICSDPNTNTKLKTKKHLLLKVMCIIHNPQTCAAMAKIFILPLPSVGVRWNLWCE